MTSSWWPKALTPSIQGQVRLRKLAGLFAGLGHLQPLLLATTNFHYLLDRFCMERCCSGEYVSRIVTSIIFMEILSIIVVRIVLYMLFKDPSKWLSLTSWSTDWQSDTAKGQTLNDWNEDKEERYRGIVGSIILLLITLGYIQIFYAFTTGGKKGHMEWFYSSLLIQHFLNSLIAGSIGFWEVGLALWYLVTLPMAPIPVFFYQLIIHSWIRNHGPRYPEYLVVEWQILLATSISMLATILWIVGYFISYIPIELEITGLSSASPDPSSQDNTRITDGTPDGDGKANAKILTLQAGSGTLSGQVTGLSELPGVTVKADVNLSEYSITLVAAPANLVTVTESDRTKRFVTLSLTGTATVTLTAVSGRGSVTGTKAALTSKDIKLALKTSPPPPNPELKVYSADVTVDPNSKNTVTITLKSIKAEGTITVKSNETINTVEVTVPVDIKVTGASVPSVTETISSVKLTLPATNQNNLQLTARAVLSGSTGHSETKKTLSINVTDAKTGTAQAKFIKVDGKGFYPNKKGHCIYSVRDGTTGTSDNKRDIWANIGGKCEYVACYYNGGKALLILYFRTPGGTPERKYFGTENAGNAATEWKTIPNEDKFITKLKELATSPGGQFSLTAAEFKATDQYNRVFDNIRLSPVWLPLVMQGLSVGAVGSIFPNLIPKTLTCPKTTRNLTVINMFLVTVPHIFNVMLGDMDLLGWIGVGAPWDDTGHAWPCSLLLYLFYILAILFAIFNIHYPEWRLSTFLRNNTWMVFLMILFTDVLNETFNAISRAGICSQKAAGQEKKLNHPCLHNKIACLMNLTYIPFWMTTMEEYRLYMDERTLTVLLRLPCLDFGASLWLGNQAPSGRLYL